MASVRESREASNPTITTKPPSIWFQEIADKLEVDEALSEMTLDYNLNLLEGEERMTEAEMAEIMEVSEVAEQSCWDCYHCMGKDSENQAHILCLLYADGAERVGSESCHPCSAKTCAGFRGKPKSEEPAFASGDYGRAFVQAEQEAMRKPKYSDYDMMLKDDEIALLKQSIDHLERENEALRTGLRGIVYDRKMSAVHGIDWKLLRDKVEVIQKPQDGKLEGCVEARKVQNG